MPEELENPTSDIVDEFEDWLNRKSEVPNGVTIGDINLMEMILLMRLRAIYTPEQLHARSHALIAQTETFLHEPGALVDDHGNAVQPILVENFEGSAQDLADMMTELGNPQETVDSFLEQMFTEKDE